MISIFLSAVDTLERLGAFAASESFDGKCFLLVTDSLLSVMSRNWKPSVVWALNVSPEGRARSEVEVLKFPLTVLGMVLGW